MSSGLANPASYAPESVKYRFEGKAISRPVAMIGQPKIASPQQSHVLTCNRECRVRAQENGAEQELEEEPEAGIGVKYSIGCY